MISNISNCYNKLIIIIVIIWIYALLSKLIVNVHLRESIIVEYTAKIGCLLYKCSYFLCAVCMLAYVWPTFNEEINM